MSDAPARIWLQIGWAHAIPYVKNATCIDAAIRDGAEYVLASVAASAEQAAYQMGYLAGVEAAHDEALLRALSESEGA